MATEAWKYSQSVLRMGNGASPEVFSSLFEFVSMSEFGQESDLLEATHMASTAKEYIGGLPDGIEVTIIVNYKPTDTSHLALHAAQAAGTAKNFELVLPPGASSRKFYWSGIVKGWRLMDINANSVGKASFNVKLSGAIVGPIPS